MHPFHAELSALAQRIGVAEESKDSDRCVYMLDIDVVLAEKFKAHRAANQRPMRREHANAYAKAITEGKWNTAVSAPIVFDVNMNLIDGQHRVEALLLAGGMHRFPNQLITVLKYEATTLAMPIDMGKKRTRRDFERNLGLTLHNAVSAGLLQEVLGFPPSLSHTGKDVADQAALVKEHPYLEIVANIPKIYTAYAGTVAAIARILRTANDKNEVVDFFTHVLDNRHEFRGLHSDNIRQLASWTLSTRANKFQTPPLKESAMRALLAWNNHRKGVSKKLLPKVSPLDNPQDVVVIP